MKTQELIKRFEELGFETEMNVDEDRTCFILTVSKLDETVVEIFDSKDGVDALLGYDMSFLDGVEVSELVSILYELVINKE